MKFLQIKMESDKNITEINLELLNELNYERIIRGNNQNKSKKEILLENTIIENNIPFVKWVIRPYTPYINTYDKETILGYGDILSAGMFGLYKAIIKYDINKLNPETNNPYKFSTYAFYWIRAFASRYIKENKSTIKVPEYLQDLIARDEENIFTPINTLVEDAKIAGASMLNLDSSISKNNSFKHYGLNAENFINPPLLRDFIIDHKNDPIEVTETRDLARIFEELLEDLSPKEEKVVRLRFGIKEEKEHTFEEIGELFAVSRSRSRQILLKAFKKLRHPSRSKKFRAYLEYE